VSAIPDADLRSLYDRYPDFDIDIAAEQRALVNARLIVWMHPMFWYSVPALLKHWFDKVLAYGFAYGDGGTALRASTCCGCPRLEARSTRSRPAPSTASSFPPLRRRSSRRRVLRHGMGNAARGARREPARRIRAGIHTASLTKRLIAWRRSAGAATAEVQ
jgi:hypothetical protein